MAFTITIDSVTERQINFTIKALSQYNGFEAYAYRGIGNYILGNWLTTDSANKYEGKIILKESVWIDHIDFNPGGCQVRLEVVGFLPDGKKDTIRIPVYMHPGKYLIGQGNRFNPPDPVESGEVIQDVLNYFNLFYWFEFYCLVRTWFYQEVFSSGEEYSRLASIIIPNPKEPETITAVWYRTCLRALNAVRKPADQFTDDFINSIVGLEESKTNGKTPTTITAELINKLNFSGMGGQ